MCLVRCWALNMTASQACVYRVLSRNILLIARRWLTRGGEVTSCCTTGNHHHCVSICPIQTSCFSRKCGTERVPGSRAADICALLPSSSFMPQIFLKRLPLPAQLGLGPSPSPSLQEQFVSLVSSFYPSLCRNLSEWTPSHLVNAI